ncbi:hypothetical protein [uncultured Mailhella sp.]|uniref:hypothetical protein n=1 Tax=uncultured Mailhella sp. TaxID=1981031 RepID=UPI003207AE43
MADEESNNVMQEAYSKLLIMEILFPVEGARTSFLCKSRADMRNMLERKDFYIMIEMRGTDVCQ